MTPEQLDREAGRFAAQVPYIPENIHGLLGRGWSRADIFQAEAHTSFLRKVKGESKMTLTLPWSRVGTIQQGAGYIVELVGSDTWGITVNGTPVYSGDEFGDNVRELFMQVPYVSQVLAVGTTITVIIGQLRSETYTFRVVSDIVYKQHVLIYDISRRMGIPQIIGNDLTEFYDENIRYYYRELVEYGIKCYRLLIKYYPPELAQLLVSYLPDTP